VSVSIYIAASLKAKSVAARWAHAARAHRLVVASTWQDDPAVDVDPVDDLARAQIIDRSVREIESAACVVVLAYTGQPRATFVEAGIAFGRSKDVVWVHHGERGRQVFDAYGVRLDLAHHREFDGDTLEHFVRKAMFR
jgi:hypothetical protein